MGGFYTFYKDKEALYKEILRDETNRIRQKILTIIDVDYNIPAVLGIGNATDLLEDGDEVFVYGDTGKVILLSKKI